MTGLVSRGRASSAASSNSRRRPGVACLLKGPGDDVEESESRLVGDDARLILAGEECVLMGEGGRANCDRGSSPRGCLIIFFFSPLADGGWQISGEIKAAVFICASIADRPHYYYVSFVDEGRRSSSMHPKLCQFDSATGRSPTAFARVKARLKRADARAHVSKPSLKRGELRNCSDFLLYCRLYNLESRPAAARRRAQIWQRTLARRLASAPHRLIDHNSSR